MHRIFIFANHPRMVGGTTLSRPDCCSADSLSQLEITLQILPGGVAPRLALLDKIFLSNADRRTPAQEVRLSVLKTNARMDKTLPVKSC